MKHEVSLDESMENKESKVLTEAQKYYDKYDKPMQMFENTLLAKAKPGGLDHWDYWSLGTQLKQFDDYARFSEASANTNQLGQLVNVAHDVIVATQGQSIVGAVSSVQPKLQWAA